MPDPDLAWPTFRALVARSGRFDARLRLAVLDGVDWAIRRAFSEDAGILEGERDELARLAFPDETIEPAPVQCRPAEPPTPDPVPAASDGPPE